MRIRPAEDDDLLDLGRLFAVAARYMIERYRPEQSGHVPMEPEVRIPMYRHLLETGVVLVAEDPRPVGFSAAVIRDGVWFLSQLWVLPERHASGIGAALLDEALAWGRGSRIFSVISSPHPAAQTLYLRASMLPVWVEFEMTGGAPTVPEMPDDFREVEDADQPWIDRLDREVRGIARPEDHAFWRREARAVILERDGDPAGYVYAWPGGKIGPGAVRDPSDTRSILVAARHLAGGPVTLTVPAANWAALRELVVLGHSPLGSNLFLASRSLGDPARYLSSGGALG